MQSFIDKMQLYYLRRPEFKDDLPDIKRSYLIQRIGMAAMGFLLPVILFLSSLFGRTEFELSMSAYYYSLELERNIFIGILCAVGTSLMFYKGETLIEDRLLDLAGLAAIVTGLFPMYEGNDCGVTVKTYHTYSAIIFFFCIALFCISKTMLIIKDNKRRQDSKEISRKLKYIKIYRFCSAVMLGTILFAVLYKTVLPKSWALTVCDGLKATFWIETIGVWSFSLFWFSRTREMDPGLRWIPFLRKKEQKRKAKDLVEGGRQQ